MTPILLAIKKELEKLYPKTSLHIDQQRLQVSTNFTTKTLFISVEYCRIITITKHYDPKYIGGGYISLQSYPISDPNSLDNTIKSCVKELNLDHL